MKQEVSNQSAREGKLVKVASKKVRDTILDRLARIVDGSDYVVLDDLAREFTEIKAILLRTCAVGRHYTVALSAETARKIFIELLLIPRPQRSHLNSDPENSATAAQELTHAAEDAQRISQVLWQTADANPTFEDLHREIAKTRNPERTAQLLFAARSPEDAVSTAAGNTLPSIPAAPRYVASANQHLFTLKVKNVDEDPGLATVVITGAEDPKAVCLEGMFDRRVRLAFDETALPGFGKLLVLAQATNVEIHLRANVQRGLGSGSSRHDELQAVESIDEPRVKAIIAAHLSALIAVNGELAFT